MSFKKDSFRVFLEIWITSESGGDYALKTHVGECDEVDEWELVQKNLKEYATTAESRFH